MTQWHDTPTGTPAAGHGNRQRREGTAHGRGARGGHAYISINGDGRWGGKVPAAVPEVAGGRGNGESV